MLRLRDCVWARPRAHVENFTFLSTTVVIARLVAGACRRARGFGAAARLHGRLPAPSGSSLAKHATLGAGALLACMAMFFGESPQPLAGASAQALPPVHKDSTRLVDAGTGEAHADEDRSLASNFDRSLPISAGQG